MTKREKIREGMAHWLFKFVCECENIKPAWDDAREYYLREADLLLCYLHSQGVVLKVGRELPEYQWLTEMGIHQVLIKYLNDNTDLFSATHSIRELFEEAGYTTFEPLMEKHVALESVKAGEFVTLEKLEPL